ncbi:SOS response-associated peptidase family protein [Piscinibacter sakaiensis]|uniref:Abasic site processing protein n=1 Tax=Piscinibacter sakaiensis TaxID=1547922 RepID=A0A0K8P1N0_PISS1|nr:SOS response-associated peptidase family protein [Piscinibacter sakaiensis]GAP36528.1 hypothetical protein ISF6_2368 [Piscinibacter sakaiensis]
MCYSALIKAEWHRYVREFGAQIGLEDYVRLFERRIADPKVKLPKATEAAFLAEPPPGEAGARLLALIAEGRRVRAAELEAELFAQRTRFVQAERDLALKPTKKASESRRIAGAKIEALRGRLADLQRSELAEQDSRIFPGVYAPVLVVEDGRRVVRPMRYQCRPAGKPAFHDQKFPGTYNARRDSLGGYWKDLFGRHHGVLLIDAFYEHVDRGGRDAVLEFRPRTGQPMAVACLWSRWTAPGEPELLSFAAITDEPPPEVAAAGHDRCLVPLRAERLDEWLRPSPDRLDALQALLDDRERPYYEHRLAA